MVLDPASPRVVVMDAYRASSVPVDAVVAIVRVAHTPRSGHLESVHGVRNLLHRAVGIQDADLLIAH